MIVSGFSGSDLDSGVGLSLCGLGHRTLRSSKGETRSRKGTSPIDQSEPSDRNRTAGVYPKSSPSVPTAAIYEPRESETVR